MRTPLLSIVVLVLMTSAGIADRVTPPVDQQPPRGYPRDFPFLPTNTPPPANVEWPAREGCLVVTLGYPAMSRGELETAFRKRLTAAGWRTIRHKHAERGTIEVSARRRKREVIVIFGAAGSAATLTLYNCEAVRDT